MDHTSVMRATVGDTDVLLGRKTPRTPPPVIWASDVQQTCRLKTRVLNTKQKLVIPILPKRLPQRD